MSSGYINNLAYLQLMFGIIAIDDADTKNGDYKINKRLDRRLNNLAIKIKSFLQSKLNKPQDIKKVTNRAMKLLHCLEALANDKTIQLEYLVLYTYFVRFYETKQPEEFKLVSENWIMETLDLLSSLSINKYEEDSFMLANKLAEELK